MSLQVSDEKISIGYEKEKPEVGASGFAGSYKTEGSQISSILPGPRNYDNRGLKMSSPVQGFLKLNRGEEFDELLRNHPDAFLLLTLIASRAKRTLSVSFNNLKPGEALVGDYKACGLTPRRYRTAKSRLKTCGLATFKETNKGTIATLSNSWIYDINCEDKDKQNDNQETSNRQATDKQKTTNKNDKKERIEEEKEKEKKEKRDLTKREQPGKINVREWVSLTEQEHKTLLERFGASFTNAMLDAVDANNTKNQEHYASDYGVMKKGGWAYNDALKKGEKPHETTQGSDSGQPGGNNKPRRANELVV